LTTEEAVLPNIFSTILFGAKNAAPPEKPQPEPYRNGPE